MKKFKIIKCQECDKPIKTELLKDDQGSSSDRYYGRCDFCGRIVLQIAED